MGSAGALLGHRAIMATLSLHEQCGGVVHVFTLPYLAREYGQLVYEYSLCSLVHFGIGNF